MRLTDLDPAWIVKDGRRIGFTFISPTRINPGKIAARQSCFSEPPKVSEQIDSCLSGLDTLP